MLIARVVGSAVSTIKDSKLTGLKLLIVQETNPHNELVIIATGSAARQTMLTLDRAVDAAIIGVIDSLEVDGETTFMKE